MKHFTQTTANGLHTPPCGGSQSKSTRFSLLTSFLLLFLLFVGSNAAWADDYALNNPIGADGYYIVKWDCANNTWASSNSMEIGQTFTFAIDITGNNYLLGIVNSGHPIAFAHYAGDGYNREYTPDCFRLKHISGNIYGATYNFKKDHSEWDTQKIWARFWDGNNWDYPGKEIHSPTKDGFFKWATNTGATSPDFTAAQIAADDGMPGGYQRNGYAAPCACEETGGGSSLSGDFYVYGAGPNDAMNWVTGWSSVEQGGGKSNPLNHMTISGNVARKTYCGVKGNNLEFKIAQNNADEATWTKYNSSKTTATGLTGGFFTAATNNNGNIRFSLSKPSDVTVCYDGTDVWLEIYERVQSSTQRRACGTFNGWSGTAAELTRDDAHGCYSVTLQNVEPRGTVYDGHQYMHFKIFKGVSNGWDGQMNANGDCDIHAMGATVLGDASVDDEANPNSEHRIIVQVDVTSNITIEYYLKGASNGRKQIAINCVPVAAPEPDPEPAVTYTVTLHPNNGGSNIVRENVPENSTASAAALNLSAVTYGNGTATWYTNAECTTPFTSVTEDNMDLYAKWGVSGNFYLVGDFGMHDKGSNWAYNSGLAMTTTDGVASVTYIAPKGRHRFEILTSRSSWPAIANQGSGLIAASTPTLSWSNEGAGGNYHFRFDLDAPKKVTIRYNGKVSVTAEDYVVAKTGWTVASKSLFGHGTEESPDNADNGAYMNGYNMTEGQMNSDGELVIHNLNAGTYKFWIGKYNTALNKQKQNVEVFGAAHVDKANSSLGDYGSLANVSDDTYNRSIPMDDKLHRRVQFSLNQRASIKIAFDGGKITVNLQPKHTVNFNSNGGSEVASQSVFEGLTASEPSAPTKAGYEFVKWQLSGVDYTFSEAVTGNITLDAVWAYKAISSVELNESEHTTWVGNSDFVLTLTKNPSDLITKSVVWSSDAEGVASVSNGTVHAVGVGTATITCTVTDMFDHVESASCEVSVAACEMTTDDLYSMTVTGYNSSTGDDATLTGLWNQSSDNTEPATLTVCNVRIGNNNGSNEYYAYDNNGTVSIEQRSDNDVDKWYRIEAATNLYYLKNVSTGKYMYVGSTNTSGSKGNGWSGNGDWLLRSVYTSTTNAETDSYKFYGAKDDWNNDIIISRADASNGAKATATDFVLSRQQLTGTPGVWSDVVANTVSASRGATQGGNTYKGFQSAFENVENVANPNYKASQMNSSYYRMKADATVRANLANGLAYGSVITVRLYADAATSVKLQTAAGDDVETINLSADAAREYTYTVAYGSELVGATAFIIKAADNHAGIASIEVSRMHAVSPADPALTWDADLSGGVTQSALAGTFQHVASSALSSGAIHYTSSNEAVATVAADGTVTPIMAGNTTITATIEQRECYAEQSINYNVTLTEPTLAELIAADAGAGITLTHDYAENIVIDKAITINGAGHAIGNLTVETAGDLTLSGALTVNDFNIYAQAGNTTTPAASGQVRNAANLTANGNAYFYYTVDPNGHVQHGWYDFTVPFRVNVMTGIKGIQNEVLKENFVNETDYAIMEHLGNKQAAGEYSYKKFRGIMEPCRLYSITLDDDFNYNTIRFQKADGALAAGNDVTLNAYDGIDTKHSNWNGVGNGTLHHADAILSTVGYIQVYQSGEKTFLPVDKNEYSLVVGSAFMVQQAGTMTLNQASHDKLLAPRRDATAQATAIQIAREGKPFSDQLYITADELAGQGYTQGVDVAKAGNIGNVNVPQIWTNAYNSKLCAHEAQLIDGEAQYTLSLYAPANGTYTLTSKNIPEGYTLYLTQNGNKLWDMSDTYVLDLTKGTTTEYGLLLVENYKMPTAVDNIFSNTDETTKIMRNGILYILQNGKVFNAQGARVK